MAIRTVSVTVYTLQYMYMCFVLTDSHCIPSSLEGHDAGMVILIKCTSKHYKT